MKRWTFRISPRRAAFGGVLYLLLGAIINVAVAWGCAWWLPVYQWDLQAYGRTGATTADWHVYDTATLGRRYILGSPAVKIIMPDDPSNPILSREVIAALPREFRPHGPPSPDGLHQRLYIAAGIPWQTMACFADRQIDGTLIEYFSLAPRHIYPGDGFDTGRFDHGFSALPLRPMWGGMIGNTLIYAVVAFGVVAFLRFVRRTACRTLRRTLATVVVMSVLFGGVTTVLVAWWCAYFVNVRPTQIPSFNLIDSDWDRNGWGGTEYEDPATGKLWTHETWRYPRHGADWYISHFRPSGGGAGYIPPIPAADFLPTWTNFLNHEPGVMMSRRADARGWPMLAMWTAVDLPPLGDDDYMADDQSPEIHHGIMVRRYDDTGKFVFRWSRLLPLAPIWPGFAINTLLFAAAWSVLLFACLGPGPVRRAIRWKRGRCLSCGYDLKGALDTGCSECGWNRPLESES